MGKQEWRAKYPQHRSSTIVPLEIFPFKNYHICHGTLGRFTYLPRHFFVGASKRPLSFDIYHKKKLLIFLFIHNLADTIKLSTLLFYLDVRFTDSSTSTVFIFDSVMNHLKEIQRGNETITVEYSQNRSSTFTHSSGGKISVKYNDKGFVREAEYEDGSNKKQRW